MRPRYDTEQDAAKAWNTRATQPVDVEKLKREVCDTVTYDIGKVGAKYASYVVSDIIDHLAASGYLRAPLEKIEGLETALMNAPSPVYENKQSEWCLWCGGKESAEAILQAARAYQKASGG